MIKNELEFTGERLTTGIYEYWSIEHLHRYAIASKVVEGKRVLDIASGEGYGTHLLSNYASSIIGVDISDKAIQHASQKYQKSNLSFKIGSTSKIPLENNSVDVVVSFETIEHHNEHDKMMLEIKRVLTDDGVMILSSPDKKYYSDLPGYKNPFHVQELYEMELEQLVENYFINSVYLKQKTIFGSIISPSKSQPTKLIEYSGNYDDISNDSSLQECPYILCIASNASLEDYSSEASVFYNSDMIDLYTKLKDENIDLRKRNQLLQEKLNNPIQIIKNLFRLPAKAFRLLKT